MNKHRPTSRLSLFGAGPVFGVDLSLDISFVVDAAQEGIVFDRTDLKRLPNTQRMTT